MTQALSPNPRDQPVYEVIKREDLAAAFYDAMAKYNAETQAAFNSLVALYAATQPMALWVWDFSSRWDFDVWW